VPIVTDQPKITLDLRELWAEERLSDPYDIESPLVTDAESGVSAPRGYRI
jgi:hypothetical protein